MNYIEKNRDFKGVWIPKEIWLNEELTMLEKVILVEIDSLDNEGHCVAGNEYLAQFCQCSESKVTGAIKKLKELGYIEIISFDGRHRRIKSCLWKLQSQTLKKYESEPEEVRAIKINNNIDNNLYINSGETSSPYENTSSSNTAEDVISDENKTIIDSSAPTPTPERRRGRKSLKDQLVEYVNELEYSEETKQALFDWIFQIGLKGKVSVEQLKEKLKNIWNIYNDESLVRESIKEAYRNNWFGFFPVKGQPIPPKATPQPSTARQRAIKLSAEVF